MFHCFCLQNICVPLRNLLLSLAKALHFPKKFCYQLPILHSLTIFSLNFYSQRFSGSTKHLKVNTKALKYYLFNLVSYYFQSPCVLSMSAVMSSPKVAKWLDHCVSLLEKNLSLMIYYYFYAFSKEIDLFTSKLFVVDNMMKSWNFNQPFVCQSVMFNQRATMLFV